MTNSYFRPVGLLCGSDAQRAVLSGDALPLAGGPLAFTHIVNIRRDGEPIEIPARVWANETGNSDIYRRLTSPRQPIAGLYFNRTQIMGVLNMTPDSFSDGGAYNNVEQAILRAGEMADHGIDVWDVGGESSRPGAEPVSEEEEIERVLPIIRILREFERLPISIDSRNPNVFRRAAECGASLINDITALTHQSDSLDIAAQLQRPIILMHAKGDPKTMQDAPRYNNVVLDVYDYLKARLEACSRAGISRAHCIIDPGIGFGKTREHNLAILSSLSLFHSLGCPILIGASRKSFMAKLPGGATGNTRLGGSLAVAVMAAQQGVQILRVHDTQETVQAMALLESVRSAGEH